MNNATMQAKNHEGDNYILLYRCNNFKFCRILRQVNNLNNAFRNFLDSTRILSGKNARPNVTAAFCLWESVQ